ncbi:MAG: hypothetical protein H5T69_13910, partial [Chloroflexi bacterium]|nr:hypothetical protein [Chloroflexota bacterium]
MSFWLRLYGAIPLNLNIAQIDDVMAETLPALRRRPDDVDLATPHHRFV